MATRQMLSRATEGTQAPTPGYLYKDLTVAAQTNPTVCQEMAQYLIQRLQKTNPNIKYKSLKLIAKVADQVPHFKRCLSQSPHGVTEIKAHIGYRGALDPVRGDEPNQKIRQAAQEALDAVYREAPTSVSSAAGGGMSSPYYVPASSVGGPRRMDGVGNPRYSDPRLDPRYNGTQPTTIGEAVREAGEVVLGMIKDPLARNIELPPSVGGVPSRGFGELPQVSAQRESKRRKTMPCLTSDWCLCVSFPLPSTITTALLLLFLPRGQPSWLDKRKGSGPWRPTAARTPWCPRRR
jgi:hypothetical protein